MFIVAGVVGAVGAMVPSFIVMGAGIIALVIASPLVQRGTAHVPEDDDWDGTLHPYNGASPPESVVDIAYVRGRWAYDSLHEGWNELHPVHEMVKLGTTTKAAIDEGEWPADLEARIAAVEAARTKGR